MYSGLVLLWALTNLCTAPPPPHYEDRAPPRSEQSRSGLQRPLTFDPSSFSLIRNGLSLRTESEPEDLSEDPYPHSDRKYSPTQPSKGQIIRAKGTHKRKEKLENPQLQKQRQDEKGYRIPTPLESARLARKILDTHSIGTLSTVFPSFPRAHRTRNDDIEPPFLLGGRYPDPRKSDPNTPYKTPSLASSTSGKPRSADRVADEDSLPVPIGLPDYYASDCEPERHDGLGGDPTILAVGVATTIRNARGGSNVTLSAGDDTWNPTTASYPKDDKISGLPPDLPHYPAAHPRFALIGYLEPIFPPKSTRSSSRSKARGYRIDASDQNYNDEEEKVRAFEEKRERIEACFLEKHPDARVWTPGNDIHESWWARLVVTDVYWFGGFGDRAYIGWLGEQLWREAGRPTS
ncbi:MAG: hypothetical protein M1831_006337 [Alyxoria varia]|nr:MAG: hypothetical protein M1831_006337 [Alyxoria varia]